MGLGSSSSSQRPRGYRALDTIAAVSTPPGRGGIGIVRLSGQASTGIARNLVALRSELRTWGATLGSLRDEAGEVIDEVVVTWFAAPRSYTAEDVVEIACHGSPVVLRHCLDRALKLGARLAEPGEFTLRAYANGRIDLPQAEGVRDLIEATTLYQARVAAQQTQGSLSRRFAPLKTQLLELIALLEAGIDFAEDDISVAPPEEILRRLEPLIEQAANLRRSFKFGNLVRQGFSLAIVGRPNVGKSSLFNRLLEQDRSIVSDTPGTTRDVVSESMQLRGIPVRVVDTAGIRHEAGPVEKLGIERSFAAMADADLTLVVTDGSAGLLEDDQVLLARAREQGRAIFIANKKDLPNFSFNEAEIAVSATTGEGVRELLDLILAHLAPEGRFEEHSSFVTSARQEHLLGEAVEMFEKAHNAVVLGVPHELVLLDLYGGLQPVSALTGGTTADDILNRIFATFCIGK